MITITTHRVETQIKEMNSEEFINEIEQAIIEDVRNKEQGMNRIANIMENMPTIPFKDMAPLLQKVFIHYYALELATEYITVMKKYRELGKRRGYGSVNAIFASSPFSFLACDESDVNFTPLVEQMKKEMSEKCATRNKRYAFASHREYLMDKLEPVISVLSPDISKHSDEYKKLLDKLLCINPAVVETNAFMYDISKYLVDIVSCWISCMKSFGFSNSSISNALSTVKTELNEFAYNQTRTTESAYLKRLSTYMERIKDPDAAFRRNYEYCWGRNEDDLHRESVKRPSDNKRSSVQLTVEEYEEINFLDDDNDDPTSNTPMAEEGDLQGPLEDDPKDPEVPGDEDDSEYNWDQDYDEYNIW